MTLLQEEMRPKTLSNVLGQTHLIGKDKILTNLIKNKKLFNVIFYGPSGVGKTTIALCLVNDLKQKYRMLNATINSKKDFEIVFEEARMYNGLILIVDEIHRMNKDKQDLLLSYIESGLITLIGLTSSNPFHSINPAIRSRCELLELKSLDVQDIKKGINNIKKVKKDLSLSKTTIDYISSLCNGDLRHAYNLIEFCYYSFGPVFNIENLKEIGEKGIIIGDKNEDGHYDLISALQKSIRGSDVDASLYYLARLIEAGDYDIIYRRLLVIAYEDIGLSNPTLPPRVLSSIEASIRLGYPELSKPLSCSVIEMALSPKSNSAYLAYNSVISRINKGDSGHVPNHIKTDSPDYKYPHDYPNYWVNQEYLPKELKDIKFYKPKNNKYEKNMYEFNQNIKKK
ncbi:MAG: replication-associated recombination protein A [Bacilli bacterium]